MPRGKFKGVNRVRKRLASGEVKLYKFHRASGLPLPDDETSREFAIAFAEAEKTLTARLSGDTFSGLGRQWTASLEFEKLSQGSQREYRRMLTKAELEFGDMPREALNDPEVKAVFLEWRTKVARESGEREGDNRLSIISSMLTWAVENSKLKANHLRGFRRLYHSNRSEIIWLPEHVEAFMKVAPLEMQRALILGLHSGAREGDIRRMAWSWYDGEAITFRPSKNRRRGVMPPPITIPCTKALRRMLDGMERVSPLILTTKTGVAFKPRYFGRQWEDATKAAGLDSVMLPGFEEPVGLRFHDLRGTAVTLLSEAGSTPQQIASITGHSLKTVTKILDRYLARTRALANQAIFNWENSPRTDFANRLQTATPAEKSNRGKTNA